MFNAEVDSDVSMNAFASRKLSGDPRNNFNDVNKIKVRKYFPETWIWDTISAAGYDEFHLLSSLLSFFHLFYYSTIVDLCTFGKMKKGKGRETPPSLIVCLPSIPQTSFKLEGLRESLAESVRTYCTLLPSFPDHRVTHSLNSRIPLFLFTFTTTTLSLSSL